MNIPQHRLELWPGYETSIRRYEDGILLCAEISTKVMRQETVLDFFHQFSIGHKKNNDWMVSFLNYYIYNYYSDAELNLNW